MRISDWSSDVCSSDLGIVVPPSLASGPYAGGVVNLPALIIALLVTWLLMIGTKESARFNAVLVAVKVTALTLFIALTILMMKGANFDPVVPHGWGSVGVVGAADRKRVGGGKGVLGRVDHGGGR